jgi:hypothetical protein
LVLLIMTGGECGTFEDSRKQMPLRAKEEEWRGGSFGRDALGPGDKDA